MLDELFYIATFNQEGEYIVVTFSDIEGTFTQGKDFKEAYEKAEKVLGSLLSEMNKYPARSTTEEISNLYPNSTIVLIGIDLEAFRGKYLSTTVRRNISLPEYLNNRATEEKINVSEVTVEALIRIKYSSF